MSESRKTEALAAKLPALDPPPDADRQRHNEALFTKLERRIRRDKVIMRGIYLLLFLAAFWAFLQRDRTQDVGESAAGGPYLCTFFYGSSCTSCAACTACWPRSREEIPGPERSEAWKRPDCFISAVAVIVFVVSSVSVCRLFSTPDALRAVQSAGHILWAPVFFLLWYPFGTGSLVARLWLDYKKTQLRS
jgi:hypothetical protein